MLEKGELVCSRDKEVVGVIIDMSQIMNNVTIAVLWNTPPTAQGCTTFVLHKENVIPLPQGTIIRQVFENGKYLECKYKRYDNKRGIIFDEDCKHDLCVNTSHNDKYDIIFSDDVETKNNKQYTCLTIEPWEIMEKDFTREEFIGFLKGNILKYLLRRKGTDVQDAEKIEHYAKKLQEVLKYASDIEEIE